MAKTVAFSLGGQEFSVPALNIGQLEEVTEQVNTLPAYKQGFAILRIALRRATPQPVDVSAIEDVTPEEIADAVTKILEVSGLAKQKDAPAGEAQASSAS